MPESCRAVGAFLFAVLWLVPTSGCGGRTVGGAGPTVDDVAPSRNLTLVDGRNGPEVDILVDRFYGTGPFDRHALGDEVDALLNRYPGNAVLHEMAADLALLRGDIDARFHHLLAAAADRNATITVPYLDEALEGTLPVSRQKAAARLLDALRRDHPDPVVAAAATDHLLPILERLGSLDRARALTPELAMVDQLALVGAFDNDQGKGFLEPYPPERGTLDPEATMQGVRRPVSWRTVEHFDERGRAGVGHMVTPGRHAVAYLATWVRAPSDLDVQLRLGTTSPVRVWVDGRLIASEENIDGGGFDSVVAPAHLDSGWSLVLIKSAQKTGAWELGLRFTDPGGRPLRELETTSVPQGPAPEAALEGEVAADGSLPEAVTDLEPPLRRQLWVSRQRGTTGRNAAALEAAQSALAIAPDHPVARYRGAMASWDHGELGKAADLLNEGVDSAGEWAHGFRWKRGRFYAQRDRYDRATEDLQATVDAEPDARLARFELADVFDARGFEEDRCRVLEALLERWPDSARGHRALADCQFDRGYLDEAESEYRAALALEPGSTAALGWLAYFHRLRGRWDRAIALRDRATEYAPESGALIVNAADERRRAGRRDEARELYRQVVELDPDWSRPWERLAVMAYEDGDLRGAIEAWQAALDRNPDDSRLAERLDFYRSGDGGGARELMPGADEIDAAIATLDELTPDPGAHTVMAIDDEVSLVRQDGSAQRMVTQVIKAVTDAGRDEIIRQRLPRNARILAAYVRTPDGERQEASSIRGGVVRFRQLDVGATVVLSYVYDADPPRFLPNHFVANWWFSGLHRQVLRARWVVLLPPHRSIATHVLGEIDHDVRERDGLTMHTFSAREIDPVVPEPAMAPPQDVLWHVSLSTLESWDEYVAWERALLSEVFRGDAELEALAVRLTEGVEEPQARFERLQHFVAEEIRYQQDYEGTIAGVRPHACPVVLERGYGDCKDKAVLLIRLAQEIGIDADYAILRTRPQGRVERDVPNQQFNHAIVYVPAQEGIPDGFFTDPTTDGLDLGNLRRDDQGATSLVLDPREGRWRFEEIPYQAPDLRYTNYTVDVDLAGPERATAELVLRSRGTAAAGLRRGMRNAEDATILFQAIATQVFDGARITDSRAEHIDDIVEPVEITLDLDVSGALRREGDNVRIQVPRPAIALRELTVLERRRTPMYVGPPFSGGMDVTYRLPPRARVVRVPDPIDITHECFTVERTVERGRRSVRVQTRYVHRCPEVPVQDYEGYRTLAQRAAAALESEVVVDLR